MTVKELKEKLNQFDDHLIVYIIDEDKLGKIWPWTTDINLSQGVNEADGCVFLDNYIED